MKIVEFRQIALKFRWLTFPVLISLTSCSGAITPHEVACKELMAVDQKVITLYNNSTNWAEREVYLQEIGSQIVATIASAGRVQGISEAMALEIRLMDEEFNGRQRETLWLDDVSAHFARVTIECSTGG